MTYKKRVWPPPFQPFFFFLGSEVLYFKGDFHQKELEKDLVLFIVK